MSRKWPQLVYKWLGSSLITTIVISTDKVAIIRHCLLGWCSGNPLIDLSCNESHGIDFRRGAYSALIFFLLSFFSLFFFRQESDIVPDLPYWKQRVRSPFYCLKIHWSPHSILIVRELMQLIQLRFSKCPKSSFWAVKCSLGYFF